MSLAAGLIRGVRHVPYEERLRQLNRFSMERRPHPGLNMSDYFPHPPRAGLRGHAYRLLQGPSRLGRRSGAFSVHVVKYWNRLPAILIMSSLVSVLKNNWTGNGPKSFLQHLCNLCSALPTFFPILIQTPDYLCFLNPQMFIWSLLSLVTNPTIIS